MVVLIYRRQLKQAGCETTLANNGVEALEAIDQLYHDHHRQFDVILMGEVFGMYLTSRFH